MGGIGVQAFTQLNQAMGMSIANSFVYAKSIGAAMEAALKSTLASIAGEALVRALFEVAQGYACAASPWTAWMAPGHYAAAKMFAVVAGVAGLAGRAIPGGEAAGGAYAAPGAAGGGTAGTTGSGTGSTRTPASQQTVVNIPIYIDGVISSDNLREVVKQISDQVTSGGAHLVANTSLNMIRRS